MFFVFLVLGFRVYGRVRVRINVRVTVRVLVVFYILEFWVNDLS